MFLWYPVLDLARAPRRTACKKDSGYENERVYETDTFDDSDDTYLLAPIVKFVQAFIITLATERSMKRLVI